MKIDLQALRQVYQQSGVDDFLPKDVNDLANKIGSQLGEIEEITDIGKKYEGILAVKVITCEKHPNADKLSICRIDDGGMEKNANRDKDGLVQVVCGAPNVRAGILAAWIPPGISVPASYDSEPFVLEAREIRSEISNGMLASANELAINDDHQGILEIDKEVEPGTAFAPVYKLDSTIIDIENKMFTHRPDCFGLLGIAREIAGIYGKKFTSPDWYEESPKAPETETELKLEMTNDIPELVPRFCAVAIADVKVGPSPLWLQVMLSKFGIKSINNIVDMTNFYMIFTGQPLHAYDYDKVAKMSKNGAVIKVKKAVKAEKLKLLNGKEAELQGGEIIIATNSRPIGIGGVIGGSDTEVDESTKNIILECANFDSYSIRRTSMDHGIFTDAVTRFTKKQSAHQNLAVLCKVTADIVHFTGGKAGKPIDLKGSLSANKTIQITPEFINQRLGLKLEAPEISKLLQNVEFIVEKSEKQLNITAPFWRTDINIPEDIVEEVGRLYGYDHLPLQLPQRRVAPAVISRELRLKEKLRRTLAARGANEVLSYSFVHGDLIKSVGQDPANSYKLKNALSPHLQYYRQSITPSLLEKIHPNIKAGFADFVLFELGKAHVKGKETDGLPDEFERLALVVASKNKQSKPAFYSARKYLVETLESLGINEDQVVFESLEKSNDSAAAYYLPGRSANVKIAGQIIGRIGEYQSKTASKLKLPDFCAGFEIGLKSLQDLVQQDSYKPLSRYPATEQDICLRTKKDLPYDKIRNELAKQLEENSPQDVDVSLKCVDIFEKDSAKQTTFRVSASSYERTLTSEVINHTFEKSAAGLQKSLNADIV